MEAKNYIMYCRKSTDTEDRQIQSIADQQRELNKLAKEKGVKIFKVFCESHSAKAPGRPMFREMMEIIKGGKADGIICWKINRLARNPVDGGEIQWLLQNSIIKSIITPGREYLTADNVMMMSVELGMANQFILDLKKDVRRGMKSKAEKGWRPHTAPIGYLNDKGGDKGSKVIYTDPERFPLIRKMWDLLLTGGYSVSAITNKANNEWGLRTLQRKNKGGSKLSKSTAYKLFTLPFYYGEFQYDGQIYEGKHEKMITKEEFDRAQTILGTKGKPRSKEKRLPFNGVIKCGECGGMITSEEKFKRIKSTGDIKSYIYHHCTKRKKDIECNQKSIKHEEIKIQIEKYLDSFTIPTDFLHWAIEVLNEQNEIEINDRDVILNNLQKNYSNCVKSISNLIQLYVSPDNLKRDLLSDEEYKSQKNALMQEKTRVEGEIKKVGEKIENWVELTEKTFHFATYAKYWFEKGDYETKTNILRALGQNFSLKDGILSIEMPKPYLIIKESLNLKAIKSIRLEPALLLENKRKNSSFKAAFSQWSG